MQRAVRLGGELNGLLGCWMIANLAGLVNAWFWPNRDINFEELFPSGFAHTAPATE